MYGFRLMSSFIRLACFQPHLGFLYLKDRLEVLPLPFRILYLLGCNASYCVVLEDKSIIHITTWQIMLEISVLLGLKAFKFLYCATIGVIVHLYALCINWNGNTVLH